MRCSKVKELLDDQIKDIPALRQHSHDWGRFNAWKRESRIIIARIFGDQTPHVKTFDGISYSPSVFVVGGGRDYAEEKIYWDKGFDEAEAFLNVLKDEIDRDCRLWTYRPKPQSLEVDADGKITLHWLIQRLPARFIFIALGGLAAAFLFGVRAGQIDWVKRFFEK